MKRRPRRRREQWAKAATAGLRALNLKQKRERADAMSVVEVDGAWWAERDGVRIGGPFADNAAAWGWLDRRGA
jgi:hypothetical protein